MIRCVGNPDGPSPSPDSRRAALVAIIAARDFLMLVAGLILAGVCAAAVHNGGVTLLSGIFPGNVRRVMACASALWFGSPVLSAPLIGAWQPYARDAESDLAVVAAGT